MLRNRVPITSGLDVGTDPSRKPKSLVDAVLFGLFVYDGFPVPGVPGNIPGSDAAAVVLVGLAAFRRPQRSMSSAGWFIPFWITLLTYLVFVSMYNEVDWTRRALRIAIMVALAAAITTERVDIHAGMRGLGMALIVNFVLFYAKIAPDKYGGALTGFLGDKNVAGLYYCVIPILIAVELKQRMHQVMWISFGAVAVFLTGSRTALAAYACAVLWIAFARWGGRLFRLGLILLFGLGLHYLELNLAQAWIFSDRLGSDLLRERIAQAALEKSARSSWSGLGLGESYVKIDNNIWFFHDSYLALYAEGGWVMLAAVVLVYIHLGLRSFSRPNRTKSVLVVEATTIALMVCALKLGEVFLSLPGFIIAAYGMKEVMNISHARSARAAGLR